MHPAEAAAEKLVSVFSRDPLPEPRSTIIVLNRLDPGAREEALQTLHQYVRSQQWNLWFTEIVVLEGKDDVATCFFKGSAEEHLVVMLAVHTQSWIVTGYEIPAAPWARVHGETLDEYVTEMVTLAKEQGVAYHEGPRADGLYLIEH